MAKLIIERDPSTTLSTELANGIERLWRCEREWWRGKKEPSVESWHYLIEEILTHF